MIKVQQTSLFVLNKLNEITRTGTSPDNHFFVHSAYERTINLMIDGQLIALQVKGSPVSPISVILPLNSTEIRDLDAHEGQEIVLEENNIVMRIPCPEADRFDGKTKQHYHMTCLNCSQIVDLEIENDEQIDAIPKAFGGKITGHSLMYYGYCEKCTKESES